MSAIQVRIALTFWQPNCSSIVYPFLRCCLLLAIGLGMAISEPALAQTEAEHRATWATLQRQPLAETTFKKSCDLIQDIGQTNLKLAYDLLAHYVPIVQKTGNRRWMHILLVNWGKGYESLNYFSEADSIFRLARANARAVPLLYGQALTYTVQLYTDWGKPDSLTHYLTLGEQVARQANDRETMAFMHIYRALSRQRQGQTAAMRRDFDEAIRLATGLPDKNALFMARFIRTNKCVPNPADQIAAYDSLLTLTDHSTLTQKPRFYERTTVYFRNPRPTILYNLVQLNLLMTDYDNAGKFTDMVYDALVKPNPNGPVAPYLNAEMSFVRSYQGQFANARALLDTSRRQFGVAEAQIPHISYFLAAGLLAEHDGQFTKAAHYYRQSLTKGVTSGAFSRFPPELFYARSLVRLGQYSQVPPLLALFDKDVAANKFTAVGLYYYETLANLRKAQGNIAGYGQALDTYHVIRDSLTNLNQYRAVQQIMARVRIRDKEQQISHLNAENATRAAQLRRERLFYGVILALAGLTIGLLVVYLRNRQTRARQQEALQQSHLLQLEKQQQIDLMESVMEAEASERMTIADQLHNEVNPMLAVVLLNVSSALETVPADAPTGPKLRKAQDVLASVTSTVRGISHRLTPQLIEQQGFKRAIEELAESVNLSGKVWVHTIIVGFERPLPLPFLSDLYRIVQELLHNVIRHAEATEATIEVVEHNRHVTILVEDNGIGIAADTPGDGQGLQTIRAKVAIRHGQMDVQPNPNGGTLVVIDNLELPEIS
jgi:signal transduction histidine kinase